MKLRHSLVAILVVVVLTAIGSGPVMAAPMSISTASPTPPNTWFGQYYDNMVLQGRPVMLRDDTAIDFDWGDGSPTPWLKGDLFSVRWTRNVWLNTGTWRFTTRTDDGVRLWVDNQLLIDQWRAQPSVKYTADVPLKAGYHVVVMEYFEFTGGAIARLNYELWDSACADPCLPPIQPTDWLGQYWDNMFLGGGPDVTRGEAAVDFDWGNRSPAGGISKDLFSARWTRTVWLERGTWRFTMTADDGARLWVDNVLLINEWHDQPPTAYIADATLGAGYHLIRMDYYEMTGSALARLNYQSLTAACANCSGSGGAWLGQYYNDWIPQGGPDVTRTDAAIDFDWGNGSPDRRIQKDLFSARWTQTARFDAGIYRFHAVADDGVRLTVDGKLVIDEWANNPGTEFTSEVKLSAGNHAIKVEYYEFGYDAKIKVWWEKLP